MKKGDYLSTILRSNKTVFSYQDIMILWQETNNSAARVRLNYYIKKGDLYHIRKGIYAKSNNYNQLELATKIFIPAYISFETVLAKQGVIFQYYSQIFCASYVSREIKISEDKYIFRKIKDKILLNSIGIEQIEETSIATKERAILDTLYINSDYYFDNLRSVNWEKVFDILYIYNNKRMEKIINKYFKNST